jgi:hypothetical protein
VIQQKRKPSLRGQAQLGAQAQPGLAGELGGVGRLAGGEEHGVAGS